MVSVFAVTASLLASRGADASPALSIGSLAPNLSVRKWIKGTPIKGFAPKGIYVVEFWATWCLPCRETMPHLTALAKANPDVAFVGVGVWEANLDGRVERFVKEMGPKMGYRVAYSGDRDGMSKTWLAAAGEDGIPTAFLVKDRRIVWIGYPTDLAKPLAQARAGTLDPVAVRARLSAERKALEQIRIRREAVEKAQTDAQALFDAGKREEAKRFLAAAVLRYPSLDTEARSMRFEWLSIEDPAAWEDLAKTWSATATRRQLCLLCAFAVAHAKKDPVKAETAMHLALATGSGDAMILEYAKEYYDANGDVPRALDAVKQMLTHLDTVKPESREAWKKMGERWKAVYEARLAGKSVGGSK